MGSASSRSTNASGSWGAVRAWATATRTRSMRSRGNAMRLSVLDLSPVSSGMTSRQALANTIDLAQHTEMLGYRRYWLAEHHNTAGLACPSPEVLIAAVAA